MPDTILGIRNAQWGVCGFTSSLYGLSDALPDASRSQLHGGTKAHRLLAEIKTYLMLLKAEGNQAYLSDIQTFCRKFGTSENDFGSFTVDGYIQRINRSVGRSERDIIGDENFGIGIPPVAVVDYLKKMWGYNATLVEGASSHGPQNGIIGVKNINSPLSDLYDGLEHYMYRYNQKIYSWGESFNSVAHAAPKGTNWRVCCLITL